MADTASPNIWMRPERPARGPRPAYSRAQITEAAIRVADAEGLEAASMRRIAAEIGTGAMTLYRYVPSRDDLIALMVDHAIGQEPLPERPSGDWRADLALVARHTRAVGLRHRWLADLPPAGAVFGPNQLRVIEFAYGALDVGLPIDDILTYVGMVMGHAQLAVRAEIAWEREAERGGATAEQRMRRNSPYVDQLIRSGEHPMFARIVMDARQPHMSPDERFRYGLDRVLDCIGAMIPIGPRMSALTRADAPARPS
ncbi:TetR/AcrR family transcriptional regulator [Actinomadura macrotermitis]|uniref:HTH tetR-type domain-containing protein n=1 Tax=Actinomadura macrotermitis TaxID=2585200 RepID=A0A7K0C5U8_9ACTN|nr:hypothetical protein [Actinomadura macrotermitis]